MVVEDHRVQKARYGGDRTESHPGKCKEGNVLNRASQAYTHLPCSWTQQARQKHWYPRKRLHSVTAQKTTIWTVKLSMCLSFRWRCGGVWWQSSTHVRQDDTKWMQVLIFVHYRIMGGLHSYSEHMNEESSHCPGRNQTLAITPPRLVALMCQNSSALAVDVLNTVACADLAESL
jgi:hypothetical protein